MMHRVAASELFWNMTDEDLIYLYEEKELVSFCNALSLDLNSGTKIINEA